MTNGLRKRVEAVGLGALRIDVLRRGLMRSASRSGRSLILAYHRVSPAGAMPEDLPPTITVDQFRNQLEILGAAGEIVPLSRLLSEAGSPGRLRFSITFDDDHANHVEHALPVLSSLGLKATFFLSGRCLHGLGAYWWEALEEAVRTHGLTAVAQRLGVEAQTVHDIGRLCEGEPLADQVLETFPVAETGPRLDADGIRALVGAGMEVGFHTVHHPLMTRLSEHQVDQALTFGLAELAEVVGKRIDTFAYPHGLASPAVARRVEAAGYRAAFTNHSFVVGPTSDRFLLGRFDPRTLGEDVFRRSLALRLNRPATGPRRPSQ